MFFNDEKLHIIKGLKRVLPFNKEYTEVSNVTRLL